MLWMKRRREANIKENKIFLTVAPSVDLRQTAFSQLTMSLHFLCLGEVE